MQEINLIVAYSHIDRGIGKNNKIPWDIKEDLNYFKTITKNQIVIMGRKTFESLSYPLPNRINIVLSTTRSEKVIINSNKKKEFFWFNNLSEALNFCYFFSTKNVFIIGGTSLYKEALKLPCQYLYITEIYKDFICDTFFPEISKEEYTLFKSGQIKCENNIFYKNFIYKNINYIPSKNISMNGSINIEEKNYLNLLEKVLIVGEERTTRNSTTFSLFGERLEFNIENNTLPLLTTKKIFFKGVVEELLWFMRGDTNANNLKEKGVHIWDGNSSKEFLNNLNLNYPEGECGPIYGFQWRHFGGDYEHFKRTPDNIENLGVDQLKECLRLIKEEPTSRRIFMSAWNPVDFPKMVLPPCHTSYQFYVRNSIFLDCHMYQRSCDAFLGLPFNIASTSLLTIILSHLSNLKPGKVIISFGDIHIYKEHFQAVKTQIQREPYLFPKIEINKERINLPSSMYIKEEKENWSFSDFNLIDYNFHLTIKVNMIA